MKLARERTGCEKQYYVAAIEVMRKKHMIWVASYTCF